MIKTRLLYVLLISSLLTGCITTQVPPTSIYTIAPEWNKPVTQDLASKNNVFVLKIATIRANRALKGTDILYTDTQYSRNSYAFSRWSDTSVNLLQTFFHIAIEKSALYKAVIPSVSVSKADFLLESNLLELTHQLKENNSSDGIVRIRFYLINNQTRSVVSTREFVSSVAVTNQNAQGAVEAINQAIRTVADELVLWLTEQQLASR